MTSIDSFIFSFTNRNAKISYSDREAFDFFLDISDIFDTDDCEVFKF
jgi:hypothetical protein